MRASRVTSDCRFRLAERKGRAPSDTRIASQRIQMMRRSISIADASGLPAAVALRAPSFRLMELLMGRLASLQRPIGPALAVAPAGDFVEVEQYLRAVDQVAEELLRDAGAALAGDGLLELLELFLHQVANRLARAVHGPLGGAARNQVDRIESALRRLALVRAQVVGETHHARGLADMPEDSVLQFLRDVLVGKRQDRDLHDGEGAAVHAVRQVRVERDALLVLQPMVLLEHRPD